MTVLNKYHHGGRVPPGAVNIMRGTAYGNPFVIDVDGDRAEVIAKYRRWLWDRIRRYPEFAAMVRALHGRDLCCCCAPAPCHGDVLERAAHNGGAPSVLAAYGEQNAAALQACGIAGQFILLR